MNYTDISAYPEHAFSRYWKQLLADPHFSDIVGKLSRQSSEAGRRWLSGGKDLLSSVGSSVDFHRLMVRMVETVIEYTTDGLTWSGCEHIPQDRGVCFLSNHRSTSLDPAFVNAVLYKNFGRTAYNAAGDNIFKTRWLGHLIRLNRGFIVRRDVDDMEEKRAEARKLSSYVNSLLDQNEWVWIAHRNGRSKDGSDQTDSAVLAMLKMDRADVDWERYSFSVGLVPVTISWELIPLDTLMARELCGIPTHQGPQRDMMNIATEIAMKKRRAHIHVSRPVQAEKRAKIVRGIDESVLKGHRLWPANWAAARQLEPGLRVPESVDLGRGRWVLERAEELRAQIVSEGEPAEKAQAVRTALLSMYARPVLTGLTP